MNWMDSVDRMDQYVIKKDGTAVDTEYFMATHVPFRDLEFMEFGETDTPPTRKSEEELYQQYIVNKADKHQMLIVRGTQGSGKSHLICWLHHRFVSDPIHYHPEKEKVIFLRRLRNTVRGAVQQLLDEGVVQDPELAEKFRKFTASTESQSVEEFQATIYGEYVKKVQIDRSGSVFKPIICEDIASFLSDKRVRAYMMRSGGPVSRCYQRIASGAESVVTDDTDVIFTDKDFKLPKDIEKDIRNNAAAEVQEFYLNDLRDDADNLRKLADYLNQFTSAVIQSCANITSENTRDLFVNLRRDLHREGKKLTIFIEDFTSFSIVESELLTALSVENGGNYSDLCRVTSVIGITDGYYTSFRDNFKSRVTKQIKVTEQSYSGDAFLLEMAARYLNAIYCREEAVKSWYHGQAVEDTLPEPEFRPAEAWDSVTIGDRAYTLYPFNRKCILTLYDRLKDKTTRNFLTHIIQHLYTSFADGMEYQNGWTFPAISQYIESVTLQPPYADSVESAPVSDTDKQRLKVLFKIWGNGTTEEDAQTIGGLPKTFLKDIGLGHFSGIGAAPSAPAPSPASGPPASSPKAASPAPAAPISPDKETSFQRKMSTIESWYENSSKLTLSGDFNKWIGEFVLQGIAWQDEGIPGYFVRQRQQNGHLVFIEDSDLDTRKESAVVVMDRSSETRTILMGLTQLNYYGSWTFENAEYYQMVLINWLERNKQGWIDSISGQAFGTTEHPILTITLAAAYLQRCLYGESLAELSDEKLLQRLIQNTPLPHRQNRLNPSWNDTLIYLNNRSAEKQRLQTALTEGSRTVMGVIGDTERSSSTVPFFRTGELLRSVALLRSKNWDIRDMLDADLAPQYKTAADHLRALYTKTDAVLDKEKSLAASCLQEFRTLVTPSEDAYLDLIEAIRELFTNCTYSREFYQTELKSRFDEEPQIQAEHVLGCYEQISHALDDPEPIGLLQFFSAQPTETLQAVITDLKEVQKLAETLEKKHRLLAEQMVSDINKELMEKTKNKLVQLSDRIEKMREEA